MFGCCRVNRHVLSVTASLILTLVLSLVVFVHVASAQDVKELKTQIEGFNGGGLSAEVNGKEISVTGGTNRSSRYGLELDPDSGIIINWRAQITVNAPCALNIKGNGVTFNLMPRNLLKTMQITA